MSSQPYLRVAEDGTYELLVQFDRGAVHILPYCFHTADEANNWIVSRKGRDRLQRLQARYQQHASGAFQYAT